MKEKILSLFLVAVMVCSLCACGGSEVRKDKDTNFSEETSENQQTTTEQQVKDLYALEISDLEKNSSEKYIIKSEMLDPHIEVVELTLDNWKEYFEDYHYVEHKVETEKNAFGEIVSQREYDDEHHGFGMKDNYNDNYIVVTKDVAFQFDGRIFYLDGNVYCKQIKSEDSYVLYWGDKTIGKVINGSLEIDREYVNGIEGEVPSRSGLEAMMQRSPEFWPSDYVVSGDFPKEDECYTDYECTRVQGTLVLIEIPENLKEIKEQIFIEIPRELEKKHQIVGWAGMGKVEQYLDLYLKDYLEGKTQNE